MNSKRLKQAALIAGLTGFVWSMLTIDPVVHRSSKVAQEGSTAEVPCVGQAL